jgi:WD40 repeat protein
MAYIDMAAFLKDNADKLAPKYYTINNSTWSAQNLYSIEANGTRGLLAPMRSVMLELKEGINETKTILLRLSHEHLKLNTPVPAADDQPANIPARRLTASADKPQGMTIYATTANGQTQCMLFAAPEATDTYLSHEDVLFVSTGVETANILTTPINMYTVSSQVPMMIDVRQNIDTVPLSMLVHPDYRTEKVEFAFYLTMNWDKECYFYDAVTGERVRIMDGTIIERPLPQNHEQRYYIEGPDTYRGSDGVTTSTTQPTLSTTGNKVWAYAPDRGNVVVSSTDLIKSATLYDITGRLVASSPLNSHLMTNTLTLHTAGVAGVYIVDVTLRDGSTERAQVIVQ